ncbi:MAG: hypothetical protein U9P36_11230 [Thermodesulfobacteriota bacterium]|nr:hypothetical protein [Thermodesulfobacteriota bacterium]
MDLHPENQEPTPRKSRRKYSSWPIAFIAILVTTVLAGAWFLFSPGIQTPDSRIETVTPADISTEKPPESQKHHQPEQVEDEEPPLLNLPSDAEENTQVIAPLEMTPQQQCDQLAEKLLPFFDHLDGELYIKEFKLNQPILQYFNKLTTKLLANPPVVTRESDDLYTILTNMAHFFRVIGPKNILLMKGILDRERDKIEDIAAELYQWTIVDQCNNDTFQMNAPLDQVYEYAGFFLNTMGGRSYLFRRDSRSRLLVNYYAILIVNLANKENMNRHGLDVREIIPRLIEEIEATNQLIYKEDYIDRLLELQEKYQ